MLTGVSEKITLDLDRQWN